MKVNCTQKDLAKGIAIVHRAVNARSPLPIFGNILLEAKDGQLRLAAVSFALAIDCWIQAEVVEEGAITVPARLFGDMVAKLLPGKVHLTDNSRTVVLELASGNLKAKFAGIDARDFPLSEAGEEQEPVALGAKLLGSMVDTVAFAASRDESRQNLTCVKVTFGPRLTLAATDGYRLSLRSAPLENGGKERDMLIPATSLVELARLLAYGDEEQPVMAAGDRSHNRVTFAIAGKDGLLRIRMAVMLVDAKYPDYMAIVPRSCTTTVAVEVAALLHAAQLARLFAKGDHEAVTLTANPTANRLGIAARGEQAGDSADELDAEIKGEAITTMVNVGFLIEMLSRLGDTQIVLELTKASRPILMRPFYAGPDEFIYVVMPVNRA